MSEKIIKKIIIRPGEVKLLKKKKCFGLKLSEDF